MRKEVSIKFFKSAGEAQLASDFLAAQGIHSLVRRSGMEVRLGFPDYDGAELFVLESDLQKAKEALEAFCEGSE
jgi:hypothetical protein